jgi:hypothetical protein
MKYYRIRPAYDGIPHDPMVRGGKSYIANELLTTAEFNRLPYVYAGAYEIVDIKNKRTFTSFGARFEMEDAN